MPTKAFKKKKEKTTSMLKRWADKYFSFFIRQRGMDEFGFNTCFTCGVRKPWTELQCGHYISRSIMSLRYDEINCNPQCLACNVFKKGNMDIYAIKLMDKHGDGVIRILNEIRWKPFKYSRQDLLDLIEKYEKYRKVDKYT